MMYFLRLWRLGYYRDGAGSLFTPFALEPLELFLQVGQPRPQMGLVLFGTGQLSSHDAGHYQSDGTTGKSCQCGENEQYGDSFHFVLP
jgi:hypothetical protein